MSGENLNMVNKAIIVSYTLLQQRLMECESTTAASRTPQACRAHFQMLFSVFSSFFRILDRWLQ